MKTVLEMISFARSFCSRLSLKLVNISRLNSCICYKNDFKISSLQFTHSPQWISPLKYSFNYDRSVLTYSTWGLVMWFFWPINNKPCWCSWPGTKNHINKTFNTVTIVNGKSTVPVYSVPKVLAVEKALKTSLYNDREDLGYRKVKCVIWSKRVSFCCPFRHTPRWKHNYSWKWNHKKCCWRRWILQKTGAQSKAFVDTTDISTTDHIPPKQTHMIQDHTTTAAKHWSLRLYTPCSQHNITMIAV